MDKGPANLILEHLGGIRADIDSVKADMGELRDDVGEVKTVQKQLTHILQELAGSLGQIHERVSKLETA